MAITASQITLAQNPNDSDGTLATFTRSDTLGQVVIPVPITWPVASASVAEAELKTAIQQWEAQVNEIAATNAALSGVTI